MLLGLLCGATSVLMADATIHASRTFRKLRGGVGSFALPAAALPPLGGLVTGLLAVICPQIAYRVRSCCPKTGYAQNSFLRYSETVRARHPILARNLLHRSDDFSVLPHVLHVCCVDLPPHHLALDDELHKLVNM